MPDWGSAGTGAAGGAAAGAALGPWGAAAGGLIGGAYGLLKGGGGGPATPANTPDWMLPGQLQDQKQQQLAAAATQGAQIKNTLMGLATGQNRQAPQIGGTQFAVDPTGRQGLIDTAGRLSGIASGQQMGAGELAVNRQLGQGLAQQTAAARMARGANAAIAARNAMRNQADMTLQGAGLAGQSRLQDQQAANQQLGQLYGGLYGQDAQVAAQNAQLGQQTQLANQQAALQQQGMNDALQMQALGQLLGWDQQTINAHLAAIQQQRANQEGPNVGASLLQGAGQLLPLVAQLLKGQGGGAAPDPNGLMKPGA